ncbi:MAG TPA: CocE/NonD family hydrolase, partial [Gemmatimonadales bacterium]|nr:CocE/NonD family hydrolase [Gemmatimonadales bacterium]
MRRLLLLLTLLAGTSAPALAQGSAPDSVFTRREEMIPMRDGVKLFTVILIPKAAPAPLPFLMTRTPYGSEGTTGNGLANAGGPYRDL